MPETYKSFGTIIGNTASTTVYSGVSGTAIVNSVVVSNVSTLGGTTITVNAVKGATSYSLITSADVPFRGTFQALDAPIVLQDSNILTATAGNTGPTHIFVSVLEIT